MPILTLVVPLVQRQRAGAGPLAVPQRRLSGLGRRDGRRQLLHGGPVSPRAGHVQRRVAVAVPQTGVCPGHQQMATQARLAGQRRQVQRSLQRQGGRQTAGFRINGQSMEA